MNHSLHIFFHVVLYALWFGGYLSLWLVIWRLRPDQDSVQRAVLLRAAARILVMAKGAFILMLPMGLQLVENLGLMALPPAGAAGAWIFALIWLGLSWRGGRGQGQEARGLRAAEWVVESAFVAIIGGAGILSLLSGAPASAGWLGAKLLLFALALLAMIVIDTALQQLFRSTAEDAVAKRRFMLATPVLVLVSLGAAYLGIAQSF
ncbi:MAG: hypothetical protein D6782_03910 [Alphaproteobacteria bacterium]|nr:MAG: hypothetical protein D6782_03910 [Alphaproteobacteria bacterium]